MMELTIDRTGDALLIRVEESRIDAAAAIRFKDAVMEAVAGADDRVVLDLSRVDFVDSTGLGAIVALLKYCAPDIRLDLAGLRPMVEKVFRLTRMDTVFRILPTPGQVPSGG